MKKIHIGFPKEGQFYNYYKDFWKCWAFSFLISEKWHLRTFVEFIIPLGVLRLIFYENEGECYASTITYTGWYWLDINYVFPLALIYIKLKLPLGKWRRKASITRMAHVEGMRVR